LVRPPPEAFVVVVVVEDDDEEEDDDGGGGGYDDGWGETECAGFNWPYPDALTRFCCIAVVLLGGGAGAGLNWP